MGQMASADGDIPEKSEGTGKQDSNGSRQQNPNSTMAGSCCITHPNKEVIYFCNQHKVDCCEICLSKDHKRCRIIPIEDINSEFSVFLKYVSWVGDNIDDAKHKLELHSKKINSHIQLGETKIRLFYDDIRSKVDEAEKESLEKLHALRDDAISGIASCDVYERLKERINNIIETGNELYSKLTPGKHNDVKSQSRPHSDRSCQCHGESFTKDKQSFNARHKELVELIQKHVSDINEWSQEVNVDFLSLEENFVDKLVSNLTASISLSPLHGTPAPPCPVYEFVEDNQIRCPNGVYGMSMVPGTDGEVLVSTGRSIQHINTNSKVLNKLHLPDEPNEFCVYVNSIAVTFSNLKTIKIYRLSNMIEYAEIKTSGICWGICRANGKFTVTFYEDGFVRNINDKGHVINSSENIFNKPKYVEVSDHLSRILISDRGNSRVVVLSQDLQSTLFIVSHPSLDLPFGLCTDNHGSIYMCSWGSNSVVKFTNDGKYDSNIISGIVYPCDVCFNELYTKLAVVITSGGGDIIQFYKVVRG